MRIRVALIVASVLLVSSTLFRAELGWSAESSESPAELSRPVVSEATGVQGPGPENGHSAAQTLPGERGEGEAPSAAETETIPEDSLVELMVTPWKDDLDGMLRSRAIRALVVPSRTMYFVDRAKRYGIAYELLTAFETAINKRFPPKRKHFKTHVVFMPVARDRLIPALLEGRGDIAVADITITPKRAELIDFSDAFFRDINEIVVTGPSAPELRLLDDLSGQEVVVRRSSSYWEHLDRLNERLQEEEKPLVRLRAAPEPLEDEDLLEMANAGLIDIIVVDDYTLVTHNIYFFK